MKPFYASALVFLAVCTIWVAADSPYAKHNVDGQSYYNVGFGSVGSLRH